MYRLHAFLSVWSNFFFRLVNRKFYTDSNGALWVVLIRVRLMKNPSLQFRYTTSNDFVGKLQYLTWYKVLIYKYWEDRKLSYWKKKLFVHCNITWPSMIHPGMKIPLYIKHSWSIYIYFFLTLVSVSLYMVILFAKYCHTKGRSLICDLLHPCCLSIRLHFNAWDRQTACGVPYSWNLLKQENMVFILRYWLLNSWSVDFCRVS